MDWFIEHPYFNNTKLYRRVYISSMVDKQLCVILMTLDVHSMMCMCFNQSAFLICNFHSSWNSIKVQHPVMNKSNSFYCIDFEWWIYSLSLLGFSLWSEFIVLLKKGILLKAWSISFNFSLTKDSLLIFNIYCSITFSSLLFSFLVFFSCVFAQSFCSIKQKFYIYWHYFIIK